MFDPITPFANAVDPGGGRIRVPGSELEPSATPSAWTNRPATPV